MKAWAESSEPAKASAPSRNHLKAARRRIWHASP
jgi:hypothetical protein